ncbi:MAG: glycosyltransferase, partial [Bacteroidales bacterium]
METKSGRMGKIKLLVVSLYNDTVTVRPEAEIFLALAKRNFDITVVTPKGSYYAHEFEKAGIKVIDHYPNKRFSLKTISLLRSELKKENYDILQLFASRGIYNGLFASMFLPVKVVLYRGYQGHIQWWNPLCYLKILNPRADYIICLTKGIQANLQKHLLWNSHKAVLIYKGHDTHWYSQISKASLQEFTIPPDAYIFSCVANARKFKGIKYLLKATHYLPHDSSIHILLIGNGMYSKEFDTLIKSSPIKHNIHRAGYRKNALELVNACNASVLPSIGGEGLSKVVIEAMCLKKPVIATTIDGVSELGIHNETALFVPPANPKALADKMIFLSNNQEFGTSLGEKAYSFIKHNFSLH